MNKILLLGCLILLAGCATPYQPIGTTDQGGYLEERIATDRYLVGFSANGFSDSTVAHDYALLRAAELGQSLGYKYFVVEGQRDRSSMVTGSSGLTTFSATPTASGGFVGSVNTFTGAAYRPAYQLLIRYYDKKPSAREGKAQDCVAVVAQLRAKHQIKGPA